MVETSSVLKVLRDAAILSRGTRGRRGMVIHLDDADDVLVAGDLHGNLANLKAIIHLADLNQQTRRHLVLQEFVHGKMREGAENCNSHRSLEMAATLKCQFPHRVHLILGNHELAEWTGRPIVKDGVVVNERFAQGVLAAHGEKGPEVLERYNELYRSMPLTVRTRNRVYISHSIPSGKDLPTFDVGVFNRPFLSPDECGKGSSVFSLLWGRDVSEAASATFASMVDADLLITGHIAQSEGFAVPNGRQIILDCVATPAAVALFDSQAPINHEQLVRSIRFIPHR